jgi:hypothetical protein
MATLQKNSLNLKFNLKPDEKQRFNDIHIPYLNDIWKNATEEQRKLLENKSFYNYKEIYDTLHNEYNDDIDATPIRNYENIKYKLMLTKDPELLEKHYEKQRKYKYDKYQTIKNSDSEEYKKMIERKKMEAKKRKIAKASENNVFYGNTNVMTTPINIFSDTSYSDAIQGDAKRQKIDDLDPELLDYLRSLSGGRKRKTMRRKKSKSKSKKR